MFKKFVAAALTAFALAACVSPKYVVSDVSRFHTLPAAPNGQTFVIATVNADQSESLAYRKYADTVSAKLQSLGLRAAAAGGPADFVVTLRYDVRGPTPDVESRGGNFGVGFGVGFGHRHGLRRRLGWRAGHRVHAGRCAPHQSREHAALGCGDRAL